MQAVKEILNSLVSSGREAISRLSQGKLFQITGQLLKSDIKVWFDGKSFQHRILTPKFELAVEHH